MQNRLVGDIGDYLKLGILRASSPGYRLGIAWWLFPDEVPNRDWSKSSLTRSSHPMGRSLSGSRSATNGLPG